MHAASFCIMGLLLASCSVSLAMISIPPREETQGCFVLLVELLVSCPTIQSPIREEEYTCVIHCNLIISGL